MKIEQIYTGCLAQGAYYIESEGEVAIIDPLRETQPYIDQAEKNNAKIKYILETHFHADFVSGHLDLAKKTGAQIVYGPTAEPDFEAYVAKDDEELKLGKITIKVLHTPGHTLESSSYLLLDENRKEVALFSGDTLFIGDVGRPDLVQILNSEMTQEKLAGYLFESIKNKIMPLADDVIVYPAHGAGSACGKNMSKETSDTLGNQKKVNYALNPKLTKEEFIKEVTDGLTQPPYYFPKNVLMNKQGYDSFDTVLERGSIGLTPDEFEAKANETSALILDTREAQVFAKGFVPNSINIGIKGSFAPWVGTLIPDIKQEILIIAEEGLEKEVITRLARVGYDHAIGYLKGGIEVWEKAGKEVDRVKTVSPEDFITLNKKEKLNVLDVRRKSEFQILHLDGAINTELDYINNYLELIDKNKTYYVHCAGGYRSMSFVSILKARGYGDLIDVAGGFSKIKELEGAQVVA